MGGVRNLLGSTADALRSLKENLYTTVLTSVTIGFSLAIFSLFIIVFVNLGSAVGEMGNRAQAVIYIKDSAGPSEILSRELRRVPGVREVSYRSKDRALAELKERLADNAVILEGLDSNPLPASFDVSLDPEYLDPDKLEGLVKRLGEIKWVDEVQFSREWAEKLSSFLGFMKLAAIVMGAFLAAATVFIVTNTIRLTVYARRDEIEVLRLIGASDFFIKAPFFMEGVLQGVTGGVLATFFLLIWKAVLSARVPAYLSFIMDTQTPLPWLFVILAVSGVVMGVAGSLISMARFLKV